MKKRYLEYDIARTIALLLMPIAHVALTFGISGTLTDQAFTMINSFNVISSLGAVLFMLCMGINLGLTGSVKPSDFLRRALKILGTAVVLNLLRYILPGFLSLLVGYGTEWLAYLASMCLHSDILNFATLYMLFFALMKKLKLKPLMMVAITAGMSLLDFFLPNLVVSNECLHLLLGNLIYTDTTASFPLLQWAVVPTCGYAFIGEYKRAEAKGREEEFWRKAALIGLCTFVVLVTLCLILKVDIMSIVGNQATNNNLELTGAAMVMSLLFVLLYIAHRLSARMEDGGFKTFFTRFSASITDYYVLQWVLIMWANAIAVSFEVQNIGGVTIILITFVITVVSVLLSLWHDKRRQLRKADHARA